MSRKQVKISEYLINNSRSNTMSEVKIEPEYIRVKEEPEAHFVLFLPRSQTNVLKVENKAEEIKQINSQNKDKEKKFKCQVCEKSYSLKKSWKRHEKTHFRNDKANDKDKFACDICGYKTIIKDYIWKHMKIHANDRPFKCTHEGCGKAFKRLYNLMRHQTVHSNVYKFECEDCFMCFKVKEYLVQHRKIVHGHNAGSKSKIHKCTKCARSFKEAFYLKHHEKRVHFECQVSCPTCGKSFKNDERLKIHLYKQRIESKRRYQCDLCGFSKTKTKENMLKHMNTHLDKSHQLRNFKCLLCEKTYKFKNDLTRHMYVHQNKVFKCEACSKEFKSPQDLKRHQKCQH